MSSIEFCKHCGEEMNYEGLISHGDGDLTEVFRCEFCSTTLEISSYPDNPFQEYKERSWISEE